MRRFLEKDTQCGRRAERERERGEGNSHLAGVDLLKRLEDVEDARGDVGGGEGGGRVGAGGQGGGDGDALGGDEAGGCAEGETEHGCGWR